MKKLLFIPPIFYLLVLCYYANNYIFNGVSIGIDRTMIIVMMILISCTPLPFIIKID